MSLDYKYKWCGGETRLQAPRYLHNTRVDGQDETHQCLVCTRCGRRETFHINERSERYRLFTYRDTLQSRLEPGLFYREYGDPYTDAAIATQRHIQKQRKDRE